MTSKITELPVLNLLVDGDLIETVDISDTSSALTGTNKQLTYLRLKASLLNDDFIQEASVLTLTNIIAYTPTADYHPATKKYIDDETLLRTNTDTYVPTADYHPATKKYVDDNEAFVSVTQYVTSTSSVTAPTGATKMFIELVGAGGSAARSDTYGTTGGSGGNTVVSYGTTTLTANGGYGGTTYYISAPTAILGFGGDGGGSSGGDINITGEGGSPFVMMNVTTNNSTPYFSGRGGNSKLGVGGNGTTGGAGTQRVGNDGEYGGGGGASWLSGAFRAGGGGAGGYCAKYSNADSLTVTIGSGGTQYQTGSGGDGLVKIVWY